LREGTKNQEYRTIEQGISNNEVFRAKTPFQVRSKRQGKVQMFNKQFSMFNFQGRKGGNVEQMNKEYRMLKCLGLRRFLDGRLV
jgi:hypothetical protein